MVDKSARTVRALDGDGKLISFYPASVGSEERPAPSRYAAYSFGHGDRIPTYHYSPKLKFKGVKTKKPFTIAAGPNNPVGNTWIDLGDLLIRCGSGVPWMPLEQIRFARRLP